MEAWLLPWTTRAVLLYDRVMAIPAARSWTEILTAIFGLSGSFWLLSKGFGLVAEALRRELDHSLAELFAVLYNLALAVLYSAVLVYAAISQRGGKDDFLAFEAAGFVFAYVTLSLVYAERSGEINPYAWPGFCAGLCSYLFFCFRTQYLANPLVERAYAAVAWLTTGAPARLILMFGAATAILQAWRWCGRHVSRLIGRPYIVVRNLS